MGRFRFHLRIALPIFFTIFVALTGISIFIINLYFSIRSLERVSFDYLTQTSQIVLENTVGHLSPAARFAEMNETLLNPEHYNRNYFDVFNTVTIPQFSVYDQFALIYFGSTTGDFWLNGVELDLTVQTQAIDRKIDGEASDAFLRDARELPRDTPEEIETVARTIAPYIETIIYRRDEGGAIVAAEPDIDYIYDPRWRPWYANAVDRGNATWSSVYTFSSSGRFYASGKVGVTVSAPVYASDGVLAGVVGIDIVLEQLSDFLETLTIGQNGRAFLFTNDGQGVAYGSLRIAEDGIQPEVLQSMTTIDDMAARSAFTALQQRVGAETGGVFTRLDESHQFRFDMDGRTYLAAFAPLQDPRVPPWNVGIVVPQDDFVGELISTYFITASVSVATLVLVILVSLYISSMITKPIRQLTAEADRIRNLELDGAIVAASPFTELHNMTEAFERMKSGIRSFKKYIPSDLVSFLIRSGQDAVLGGKTQEVSIFFSDVADFTTIAETLTPNELVNHLGDYLGNFSGIIADTGGTVDKYIGDAVMAFWNAPTSVAQHAHAACLSAIRCRQKLIALRRTWKESELPLLYTRIGLHVGDVVVGNMGSEERLNYTILGDPVNLTSRLEGLAKTYGVVILASEDIRARTEDAFAFRRIDRVMVKGKTIPVTVYELVGERDRCTDEITRWIETYERGLEAYFAQAWDAAEADMKRVLEMRPRDRAASLFLTRIENFRSAPPGAGWDGVAQFTTK